MNTQSQTNTIDLGTGVMEDGTLDFGEEQPQANTVRMRLTIDVTYNLNSENATELCDLLRKMCERAIGQGMLTGESGAQVEEYALESTIRPEPLDEDELAAFMLQRIEDGDLDLEDIPVRLARYGLLEPDAFTDEMRKRMQMREQCTSNFVCMVSVSGEASAPEDQNIPGSYAFRVSLSQEKDLETLASAERSAIAGGVLDCFHHHTGIEMLEDFEIRVLLPDGREIQEEEEGGGGEAPASHLVVDVTYLC